MVEVLIYNKGDVNLQSETNVKHNIIMEERNKITVSAVTDVESFDDNMVVLMTQRGELTIKGDSLHISMLNVDTGELVLDGEIFGLMYTKTEPKKSVLGRVFK